MAIFIYPAQSVTASNPSVGLNGAPAPLSSTLVAGTDGTNLVPVAVNASGALALPQGAATAAKQDTGNASLSSIDSKVATAANQTTANSSLSSIDAKLSNASQKTQIVDGSGNVIGSTSNALNVNVTNATSGTTLTGVVDPNNSTTTPLGISGVFTGTSTDIKDFGTVSVLVASDVASAAGGFSFQFSNDGTNWDHAHNFDFAGGNLSYNISAEARYFRLVYTNGAVAQTHFRLQTVLRPVNVFPSQYTVAQTLTDYALSTVTKGVIYGKTTGGGGGYVAVKVNPSGALTTENTVTSSVLPTGASTSALQSSVQSAPGTSAGTAVTVQGSASGVALPTVPTYTGANGSAPPTYIAQVGGLKPSAVMAPLQMDASANVKVSVEATVLATGAATSLNQVTANSSLSSIDGKLPSNLTVSATRLLVDGSGVTQPISAASLPLPTGAATETTLSALNQRLPGGLVPAKFDEIAVTYVAAGNGVGEVQTAVFKLAAATVATLTLSYNSSNKLTGVVKT